jgi:hypothetical protein
VQVLESELLVQTRLSSNPNPIINKGEERVENITYLWCSVVLSSAYWTTLRNLWPTLRIGICEVTLVTGLAEDGLLVTFRRADDVQFHVHYTFAWFDVAIHGHVLWDIVDLSHLQSQQALPCYACRSFSILEYWKDNEGEKRKIGGKRDQGTSVSTAARTSHSFREAIRTNLTVIILAYIGSSILSSQHLSVFILYT